MNQPYDLPIGVPGLSLSIEEQAVLWQQVLTHSTNGFVGLAAVRDSEGTIIDFRYRFLNQIALQDTRRNNPAETGDIVGRLLTDFFPTIRETPVWQTYIRVVETGEAHRFEQSPSFGDRNIWIVQSAAPIGHDGLLLSYTETSDLHQTARRLARQTTLLNGVLNSSPNGIVVFEAVRNDSHEVINFQITLTNRQFEILTGRPDRHFTGLMLTDVYPLDAKRMSLLKQRLDSGETIHVEEFIAVLDRWFDITLKHLNDGFVATIQDITTDKQVRQQLESTVQELHRSNQSLEQFAYVASHDLQEPLRKIVSLGDLLRQKYASELSDTAADLIRRMQTSASRMRSLVQDLLTFSRLSGDVRSFRLIDLNQLLASITHDLEFTILDRHAAITISNLPGVWGDPALLRQLFQNLLSNALKFQQKGASGALVPPHISINGQPASASSLPEMLAATGRRFAVINVTDNGIGFDERYLDRIFTIFQQLHGRMQYDGTGMGLAICKKVADIHGGHITATSQEGQGATFRVFLPMR